MMVMAASLIHARPLACAAASASLYPARLVPQPPDLVMWVRREGGFVHHSIKIANLEDEQRNGDGLGLGLVATEDIPKGSDLIVLPQHILLRFESKDGESSALVDLARQIPEELWAMKLGLKLLQERSKRGSFWWPYISNLPETYSVPILLLHQKPAVCSSISSGKRALRFDFLLNNYSQICHTNPNAIRKSFYAPVASVNKRCRFLLEFDKFVKSELGNVKLDNHPFGGQAVDASALGWAMSAVSSRAFRLHGSKRPGGAHVDVPMMLPLIDMCNHSFMPNAEIVQEKEADNDSMLVKVIAGEQIKQDDPLELNYGCLSNDLFLLDYGFVVPSNPYNCIELKYDPALLDAASMAAEVSSPNFSSPSPWQQQILYRLHLDGENSDLKVRIGGSELVEDRLLAALRVVLFNDREAVEKQDLDTLKSITAEAPLGVANEAAVLRTVIALCVIALSHFPTKIMEDESLLKKEVSALTELAVRYRIQKKAVIVDAMRDLTRRVNLLSAKQSVPA